MKQFYFSLLLVLFTFTLHAQHCGFDNIYLMGIRPFAGDSANIVKGLTITLVDQYHRPLNIHNGNRCTQNTETKFRHGYKPVPLSTIQYYFAKNDYVHLGAMDAWKQQPVYIKIEDDKGLNKGQKYPTQFIPYSQLDYIHLCSYSAEYKDKKFEKYRPIWVDLEHPKALEYKEYSYTKPFVFVLDQKPENVDACEAVGCFAVRLQVIAEWSNKVLYDQVFQGIMNHNNCPQIYAIGDYNFDGYPDFRLCTGGDGLHYNDYYLYDAYHLKFYRDSLLSSFYAVDFQQETKTAVGYSALKPYTGHAYQFEQEVYRISGEKLAYVKVEKILSGSTGWHPQMEVVDSFFYVNQVRKEIPRTDKNENTRSLYINGWRVERQVMPYYGPETTELKPPGYVRKQLSAAVYRIYRIADEKLLATLSGEQYLDFKPEYIKLPIVKDIDFDGSLDLWIPKSDPKAGYNYYGFNASKSTFELLFVSNLIDVQIDTLKQSATGYRLVYGSAGGPPAYKTVYELRGKGLPIYKEFNEPLLKTAPTPAPFNPVIFSKSLGGYRYELRTIEADDTVQLPAEKGAYAQKVVIVEEKIHAQIAKFYIYGNQYEEGNFQRKELEIKYLNFDPIPDVIVAAPQPKAILSVFLSCQTTESVSFYYDQHLSLCSAIDINTIDKQLTGTYQQGVETFFVEYRYLTNHELHLTRQNSDHPTSAMRAIFKNECGRLTSVSGTLVKPITSAPKREFTDFNFDGIEDFRVACDSLIFGEYPCWNYFFFNPKTNNFELQTALQGATAVKLDTANRQMLVSFETRERIDYRWYRTYTQFVYKAQQLIPHSRTSCTQHSPQSERYDCAVESFENGKWVFKEFMQGAE